MIPNFRYQFESEKIKLENFETFTVSNFETKSSDY